jgi:Tol biopolymer transport system component
LTAEQSKLTEDGTLVGTFNYMAPEQLEGKETDPRTDIFSFGEVLYEMVTGKPAFSGKSKASLIASILSAEPTPINQLRPIVPPALERLIMKCLAKDPDDRWQSASDLATELRWIAEDPHSHPTAQARPGLSRRIAIGLIAMALVAGMLAVILYRRPKEEPRLRAAINLPSGSHLAINKQAVLSPNGQLVAMVLSDADGKTRLWVRKLAADTAQPINDSEGAMAPFWSPDSQSVGFFTFENKLKRVALTDGTVQTLCDTGPGTDADRAGTWNQDGVIVYSTSREGLYRIPAAGGTPEKIPVDGEYRWPFFLPDGRHFLALSQKEGIVIVALKGGLVQVVLPTERGPVRYADPGYLLFTRQRDLIAQSFDARRLQLTGSAKTVAFSVEPGPFSFSATAGSLLHVQTSETQLTWVDQEGNELSTVGEPGHVSAPFLSPDGNYTMATITDPETQRHKLWLFDFRRGIENAFTFGTRNEAYPIWSPDGKQVAFTSSRENGQEDLYIKAVNGGGNEQSLLTFPGDKEPDKFSPDGRFLLFDYRSGPGEGYDVWILPMFGDRKPYPFIERKGNDGFATFSPDGKWVAYLSDESGQPEVYVVPFPGPGGKWRISKGGGGQPIWPKGKELFYVSNAFQLIGVQFEVRDNNFIVGKSRRLFEGTAVGASLGINPDASASIDANQDASRWLVAMPVDERNASPLILTKNWLSPN